MKELSVRVFADVVLFTLVCLMLVQLQTTKKAVEGVRLFAESAVTYTELVPEKKDYHPGDPISFYYTRKTEVLSEPLLLLTIDSFENVDTGEVFPGTTASRIVRQSGYKNLKATRVVPEEASPGQYKLEGWLSIQGTIPIRSMPYSSETFSITPKT